MSRQQKLVLLALALLAVVFAVLIGWGQIRPGCGAQDKRPTCKPGAGVKALRKLFSGAGPKVELPQQRYALDKPGSVQVDIGPSSDTIRTLKLKRVQGAFKLNLVNAPVQNGPDIKDQDKDAPLPRDAEDPEERNLQTFAVTGGGGRLSITCVTAPCAIEAQ